MFTCVCVWVCVCVGVSYRADLWLVWCLFDVVLRFTQCVFRFLGVIWGLSWSCLVVWMFLLALLSIRFRDVYVGCLVQALLRVGLWPIQSCFRAEKRVSSGDQTMRRVKDGIKRTGKGPEDQGGPKDQRTKGSGKPQIVFPVILYFFQDPRFFPGKLRCVFQYHLDKNINHNNNNTNNNSYEYETQNDDSLKAISQTTITMTKGL